jgi:hypothetical protein
LTGSEAGSTGSEADSTGISLVSSTGAESSTGSVPPPLSDAASDTPFFETNAGIAIVATSATVAVAGAAALVWVYATGQQAAATGQGIGEAIRSSQPKKNAPKKKHKTKHHKEKKRMISSSTTSDQAAVSDLLRMPRLKSSRSRLVGISIE